MATVEVGAQNFGPLIDSSNILLVDFWAEWCGPCRMFGPIFENASERHPDVVFGKVDTEIEQQLSGELGISSIPTLMVFREGILLYNSPGALPETALEEIISKVKELDMEEIRKEVEKQESEN
ncbi:MAG: thioredoxin [Actinomycetota bacterium]